MFAAGTRAGLVRGRPELEQELRSIAVPVYDASGQVLAALNVSTHAGRVTRTELEQRFCRSCSAPAVN